MDAELTRRYANVRAAMAEHDLDALVVSGSEYSGFEGSVTYLSGFQIVHRYAYVVVPADGEPQIVFPSEARYVGEHGTAQLEQVFHDRPGEHIASVVRDRGWRRVGVYGLDYIMSVRDFRALDGSAELVPFDVEFDHARAVKSDAELESVRESVRINEDGFEAFHARVRAGQAGRRGDGRRRGALRRARLRPADDEHGADRARVRDREGGDPARRLLPAVARGRRAGDALGGGVTRDRQRRTPRRCACSRPTRSTTRRRRRRCGRARPRTTSTGRSRRASPSAATTSAT